MNAPGAPHGTQRRLLVPAPPARRWIAALGAASAIAGAYFLAAWLGLVLLSAPSDVAVFWPASGIAAGILIVSGRRAFPTLAIGVVVGTVAANLMSDRSVWTSLFKGFCNAGEAILVAWLLELWFGRPFTFGDLRRVAGFLAAAGLAVAASAIGGAGTMTVLHTAAPFWDVWRAWFLSDGVGIVVVAPLVISLTLPWREQPSSEQWIEGLGVLALLTSTGLYVVAHPAGSWISFSPGALVMPMLLWLTARFPPPFAIAGAFAASITVILATTFGVGRFGDAAVPIMERIKGAQAAVITVTLYTLALVALFTQRKDVEQSLRESQRQLAKERSMLARLHEVGARLWLKRDLHQALDEILAGAIDLLGADMGTIRIVDTRGVLKIEAHRGFKQKFLEVFEVSAAGDSACGRALRSGERMVIADVEEDPQCARFRSLARAAGYRAMQSTPIMNRKGMPLGMLATHFRSVQKLAERDLRLLDLYVRQAADIIERHEAEAALRENEERLRERNAQLALAGRAALVGSFAYDVETEVVQISEGYATIFGFREATAEIVRSQWQAQVHPEDLVRLEDLRNEAFRQRKGEYSVEYRTCLPGRGVRWIEGRSFVSYDGDGHPRRMVGVNIDVTERKRAEERQRVLVAELDHRVKNVLASVSAVVTQTRQESTSVAKFVAALDGRIRSMATTHELLRAGRWQGISVTELVRRELAPYASGNNTEINGPELVLRPEAAQAMAMVLHELATNAAKHGALSTRSGRVAIRWDRRLNGQPQSRLVLEWHEIGGPPVVAIGKPSYGTSTIRDLIPYEFGGTVDLVLAREGIRCRLQLPADWICSDGEAFSNAITHANDSREINDPNNTRGPQPTPVAAKMPDNGARLRHECAREARIHEKGIRPGSQARLARDH